ncbi:MAG: prolipoprotein diacylglyceryl transferase [Bacteroidales bacterium]|nr:prolipoprotein diacylglyceryl transferase [Bacteroidales bacterium]
MLSYFIWHSHIYWHGIHCYATLFCLGLLLGACVVWWGFRQHQLPQTTYNTLVPISLIGIILGARLVHCLFYEWDYYVHHLLAILLPFSHENGTVQFVGYHGLASHGATLGLMLAVLLFSKQKKISWLLLFDLFAIATPLAGCFIRIGNFFNSEILGTASALPWAIIFADVDPLPRHPVQLYEAIAYALIFLVNIVIWRRHRAGDGLFLGLNLTLVCVVRLALECIKEEQADFAPPLLTMGQWLTLPFLLFGLVMLLYATKRKESR